MKILMPVLHYYPVIGGLETWTQNIAERLSGESEIFVVTSRVGDSARQEVKNGVRILRTSLFNLRDLSHSSAIFILGALPCVFFRSLVFIWRQKINLLHCQGFLSSFLGYLLSRISGVPYIVTVQRLETGNFLKKITYRNARLCIAASSAVKSYFEGIGCKNIKVIPNGVDLARFENLKRQPHKGFIIMTVARLEKVKGMEYLIKSVSSLKSQILGLQLLVIGDGSERKNLEKLARDLNLEEKIKFLGPIPPEGIPEYLTRADCFVLPSLKEGFGIAVLEAGAAGVPVIASGVGGILDIIKGEESGILVEPKNPEAIARAVLRIYASSDLAGKLAQNAKNNLEKYDWQNIAKKVYENYLSYANLSA